MKFATALLALVLIGCSSPTSSAQTPSAPPDSPVPPRMEGRVGAVSIANDARRSVAGRVFSFGQIFQPGAVRPGDAVRFVARGGALPTQIDAKALNPDGTVRHAIVSVELPELGGGETLKGVLVNDGRQAAPAAAGLGAPPDLKVTLALVEAGGQKRTVEIDLPSVIRAAEGQKPDLWLSGPLGEERRYFFDASPRLQVAFDVFRARSGPSRVDVIFHNDWNDLKPTDDVRYDVDIAVGGRSVFKADGVRHYPNSTWHRLIWSDGAEALRSAPDLADLVAAGATPRYDPGFVITGGDRSEFAQAARSISSEPLNPGTITRYMPTTGMRMDIGPLPTWAVVDLLDSTPLSRRLLLGNADAGGSIPWHIRERTTKLPLTLDKYPDLWLDSRSKVNVPLAQAFQEEANGWTLDTAHQPSLSYVPYLVTGLRYYKDELAQQAAYVLLAVPPGYRGNAQGLFIGAQGEAWEQVRAVAWSLRTLANAAYILPKNDPMQGYFDAKLRGNLAKIAQVTVQERRKKAAGAVEGWFPGCDECAPWQQGFMAASLGWINDMGYPDAGRTLKWMSNFLAGLFTSEAAGFDPRFGTSYRLVLATKETEVPFSSWSQVAKASGLSEFTDKDVGEFWVNYGMIMRAGLASAYAVDRLPRTKAAYDYVNRRLGVDAKGGDPTFAIVAP